MDQPISQSDLTALLITLDHCLGTWREIVWRHSRRYRHHGYVRVMLPAGTRIPCACMYTHGADDVPSEVSGAEAVLSLRSRSRDSCAVLVYEKDGEVRHEHCGKVITSVVVPFAVGTGYM